MKMGVAVVLGGDSCFVSSPSEILVEEQQRGAACLMSSIYMEIGAKHIYRVHPSRTGSAAGGWEESGGRQ